jgi:hypothetical protein
MRRPLPDGSHPYLRVDGELVRPVRDIPLHAERVLLLAARAERGLDLWAKPLPPLLPLRS